MDDDSVAFWIGDGPDDEAPTTERSDRLFWLLVGLLALISVAATLLLG